MEDNDLAVVGVKIGPSPERPRASDPSLLVEARIKVKNLREFLVEEVGDEAASLSVIRDFNLLRALVMQASPRLVGILPPDVQCEPAGPDSRFGPVVTCRELYFFCGQIKEFLDQTDKIRAVPEMAEPIMRVDDGASLFGPDGFKHNAPLLAAARAKAQILLDHVQQRINECHGPWPVPLDLLEDYNALLAPDPRGVARGQSDAPSRVFQVDRSEAQDGGSAAPVLLGGALRAASTEDPEL